MENIYQDFQNTGYIIIRDWLSEQHRETFIKDYESKFSTIETDYESKISEGHVHMADWALLQTIFPSIQQILSQINHDTNIQADLILGGFYTDTKWMNYDWHLDHGSYYIFQQLTEHFTLYIPIKKVDSAKSGLSFVPLDVLKQHAPEHYDRIVYSGAMDFIIDNNTTIVKDHELDETFVLPVNLDKICISPILNAGDLLITNGNVIHKTQDNDTERIALILRSTNSQAPITKHKLLDVTSAHKTNYIKTHTERDFFGILLEMLKTKDVVSAAEFVAHARKILL
jgi:ectoine hydroxylase-related dioxygenase (phytanoyl-CoA dioxygenase family)